MYRKYKRALEPTSSVVLSPTPPGKYKHNFLAHAFKRLFVFTQYSIRSGTNVTEMTDPRRLHVPRDFEDKFLLQAEANTSIGIETCGLLCGKEADESIRVTHLLIPRETGTYNTVEMLDDELVADSLISNNLMVVGWVLTHPTQTAFLSSIDVLLDPK